jgi:hypothetical protein
VFPFEGDHATVRPVAEELLEDILNLLGPLTDYLHHVETAYLRSRPRLVGSRDLPFLLLA